MTIQNILIGMHRENIINNGTASGSAAGNIDDDQITVDYFVNGGFEKVTSVVGFTETEISNQQWLRPDDFVYNYEVRFTHTSGNVPFGVDGVTFYSLDLPQGFGLQAEVGGQTNDEKATTVTVDFRRKGDTNILYTKTVELETFYQAP
jgi:hypothetical protein